MTQHQFEWRFCRKCSNMTFKNGIPGVCKAGDDHSPQGFNFALAFDRPESAVHERHFFFCSKCHSLFQNVDFGSGSDLGFCAKGGQHDRTDSIEFVLAHDTPVADGQTNWVVCVNCNVMFFGSAETQHCNRADTLSHDPGSNFPDFNLQHTTNPADFLP